MFAKQNTSCVHVSGLVLLEVVELSLLLLALFGCLWLGAASRDGRHVEQPYETKSVRKFRKASDVELEDVVDDVVASAVVTSTEPKLEVEGDVVTGITAVLGVVSAGVLSFKLVVVAF